MQLVTNTTLLWQDVLSSGLLYFEHVSMGFRNEFGIKYNKKEL